jgi:hypothetical protein
MEAANHINVCLYVALSEAKTRASDARGVAEGYASAGAASR